MFNKANLEQYNKFMTIEQKLNEAKEKKFQALNNNSDSYSKPSNKDSSNSLSQRNPSMKQKENL